MLGRLSVVSPQFTAALIFLTIAAWAGWRRVRRSRRRQSATAVAVTATVLSIACALTLVNAYFGYLPHVRDVTSVVGEERNWPNYADVAALPPARARDKWPAGVTVHLDVPDRGSGFGPTSSLVYLPPQYFTDLARRFPVVYLFHGAPGVPGDWFRGGQAAQDATRMAQQGHPVIVVSPRMSHHWLDDPECVDGVKDKVETHLLHDVIPTVDGSLRTNRNRSARTFGGMSAGGYCALNLGLRHRDLVSAVIDMSGLTEPTHDGGVQKVFGTVTQQVQQRIDANTPAVYASWLPPGPPTMLWIDCGTSDTQVLDQVTPLAATLRAHGIRVRFRVRAGAHTFQVWEPALREALPWSQGLTADPVAENPSRPGPEPAAGRPSR